MLQHRLGQRSRAWYAAIFAAGFAGVVVGSIAMRWMLTPPQQDTVADTGQSQSGDAGAVSSDSDLQNDTSVRPSGSGSAAESSETTMPDQVADNVSDGGDTTSAADSTAGHSDETDVARADPEMNADKSKPSTADRVRNPPVTVAGTPADTGSPVILSDTGTNPKPQEEPSSRPPQTAFPGVKWEPSDAEYSLTHTPGAMSVHGEAFNLSDEITAMDCDRRNGTVAVFIRDKGIVLYDVASLVKGDLNAKGHFANAQALPPVFHRYKQRSFFATAVRGVPEIILLDSKTLKEIERIDLSDVSAGLAQLTCSRNDSDPFLYFLNDRIAGKFSERICRVSLDTMKFDSALSPRLVSIIPQHNYIGLSDHGDVLSIRNWSHQETARLRWGSNISDGFSTDAQYLPGPTSSSSSVQGYPIAFGSQPIEIHNRVLKTPLFQQHSSLSPLDFEVRAFSERPFLALGTDSALNIRVAHPVSGKPLAVIPFPDTITKSSVNSSTRSRPAIMRRTKFFQMEPDEKNDMLICGMSTQLLIVPLPTRDAAKNPVLIPMSRPDPFVKTGDAVQIPLKVLRSDTGEEVAVSVEAVENQAENNAAVLRTQRSAGFSQRPDVVLPVADEPASAITGQVVFHNGTLTWTPTFGQLGPRLMKLKLNGPDGITGELNLEFFVQGKPSVELPFYAQRLFLNHDGSRAFVWGTKEATSIFNGEHVSSAVYSARDNVPSIFIATIDTQANKLLSHREWPGGVESAAVTDQSVYVCEYRKRVQPGATFVTRLVELSADKLEQQAESDISRPGLQIVAVGNRRVIMDDGRQWSIPGLRSLNEKSFAAGVVADGFVHRGVYWDEAMEKPRLLADPRGFCNELVMGDPSRGQSDLRFKNGGALQLGRTGSFTSRWVRSVVTNPLLLRKITHNTTPAREYLGHYSVEVKDNVRSLTFRPDKQLKVQAPPITQVLDVATVDYRPNQHPANRDKGTPTLIANAPGTVVAAFGRKMFIEPTADLIPRQEAFHFRQVQSAFVLKPGEATKLEYECPQATRYFLELGLAEDGKRTALVTLESQSGEFEVNQEVTEQLRAFAAKHVRSFGSRDSSVAIPACIQKGGGLFRQLTGRPPEGIPLPLYVIVQATAPGDQRAAMIHWILLEIPEDGVEELVTRY